MKALRWVGSLSPQPSRATAISTAEMPSRDKILPVITRPLLVAFRGSGARGTIAWRFVYSATREPDRFALCSSNQVLLSSPESGEFGWRGLRGVSAIRGNEMTY